MKIQWKIVYSRCIDCLDLKKNLDTFNMLNVVQNRVQQKIVYIKCTNCVDLKKILKVGIEIIGGLCYYRCFDSWISIGVE